MAGAPARLRDNMAALGVLLVANTVVPLITMPYLTRTLGAEAFGQVAFVQAVMTYMALVSDYAFSWSATRDVAACRDEPSRLSRTVRGVWAAQWVLTLMLALALALFLLITDASAATVRLYACGFVAVVLGNTLLPIWLFQGLERMREIAVVQVGVRVLTIPVLFLLVQSPEHGWRVLGVQAVAAMLAGLLAIAHMVNGRWVHWQRASWPEAREALRDGFGLFLSKVGVSFYTALAPIALGLMSGPVAVSYFTIADRLRAAGQSALTPIAQALFPRLSHLYKTDVVEARQLARRGLWLTLATAFTTSTALFVLAEPLVALLGGREFAPATDVLRLLAVLPVVVGLSNVFGVQIMLPNQRTRAFNTVLGVAALLGVVSIWPLSQRMGALGAGLSVVLVECFVTLAMAGYLLRHPQLWQSK